MAAATMLIPFVAEPWQLFAAYILMAFGWVGLGTTTISTILSLWFRHRGGLAISLALNGASSGGIIVAPALVFLSAAIGFSAAMLVTTAIMLAVLLPTIVLWIDRPRGGDASLRRIGGRALSATSAPMALTRRELLRSMAFWTIAAPAALSLLAQIGVLVHQIAFLEPMIGRAQAGFAVVVTTLMAVVGRLVLGSLVDRLDPRVATAASLVSQGAALFAMTLTTHPVALLVACGIYGFSVGNIITLPPLIIQREFAPAAFSVVMGLASAIGTFVGAFGPALVGLVRDLAGGYRPALMLCIGLTIAAAIVVLLHRPTRSPT
jgi:predicted MFS family arabinose efflux permease